MMDKNEEKYIEHRSKIDDVFAFVDFQAFRGYRRFGKGVMRITQTKEDFNKPADGNSV